MKKKNAQAWGFDLMVASFLFIIGIIVFYLYSLNYPTEGQESLDVLFYEGNIITDNLLSDGLPPFWNATNVVKIGVLSNNEINETKLTLLYNLTNETITPGGYDRTKVTFDTQFDYFLNFSETTMTINGEDIAGIGRWPTSSNRNLIKISRLVVYNKKPTPLNLYLWE